MIANVRCLWCGQRLEDGREETGFTGEGPDWGSIDSWAASMDRKPGTMLDYGCSNSPDTDPEEGVGSHTPNILATWDGHLVRVRPGSYGGIDIEHLHDDKSLKHVPLGFQAHGASVDGFPFR